MNAKTVNANRNRNTAKIDSAKAAESLPPVVTIDGPAAAGKGTVARMLAEILQFHYLDSGKLYRAVAVETLSRGLRPDDENSVGALAAEMAAEKGELSRAGADLPEAGAAASILARIPAVRRALLPLQRRMRRPPGLVADGRDMGTVVFADAELKVFLTADLEIRAARRLQQLQKKGICATISSVLADLQQRDEQDRARAGSPLAAAADAVVADSSRRSAEVVAGELAERFAALRGIYYSHSH